MAASAHITVKITRIEAMAVLRVLQEIDAKSVQRVVDQFPGNDLASYRRGLRKLQEAVK